jgi:hypothetical protein
MTSLDLVFTDQADSDLNSLEQNTQLKKRLNAVRKALGYLQLNPRHPSLKTHKYTSLQGKNTITITPHP